MGHQVLPHVILYILFVSLKVQGRSGQTPSLTFPPPPPPLLPSHAAAAAGQPNQAWPSCPT